jgi:hypothetical protein
VSLAIWQATITDEAGNVLPAASVTVRREVSGSPLAVLYSDRAGTTISGNPVTADANGFVSFYAAGGAYRITATSGDFTITWRYVAVGLAGESDGVAPGVAYLFDSATGDADPTSGYFRFDSANPATATQLFISEIDRADNDVATWLGILDDAGTVLNRGVLIIKSTSDAVVWMGTVTSTVTDAGAYRKVSVTPISSSAAASFIASTVFGMTFTSNGAPGEITGPGATVTDGQLAQFSSGTGTAIEGAVVSEGSPTDPLVSGTVAGIRAAVPGHVIEAGHLRTASVEVALSDAADVAIDWQTGINFTLTMAGNRNLSVPSNGIPGTWRSVYLAGNDATARMLTFPAAWAGVPPTLTDVTSTKTYLLMIYCRSQTQFIVTSVEASP